MNLGLRFLERGGRSERLGNRLAIHFASQAQLRIVTAIVGFGAVAARLSAAARDSANRAWAKITQRADVA